MELKEREVTLKLKTRPLRCAYLVRDRKELLDAITLYTHVWGGAANVILPMPNSDEEIDSFKSTLEWMNPDCVFSSHEKLPQQVSQVLDKLPILIKRLSSIQIEGHITNAGSDLLRLIAGSLSHMGLILSELYPNRLEESDVRLINTSEIFNLEVALHLGLPSKPYRDYLFNHLSAVAFSQPESIEQLLKMFLTVTKFLTPSRLTLEETTRICNIFNSYIGHTSDRETLCLFLDDDKDLGIATAFWNYRWFFPENKVFLPREAFLRNIRVHTLQIIEFMPWIRALNVTTPFNREEALDLHRYLNDAFIEVGREVVVKINYRDFKFDWIPGTLSSGKTADFTRVITSEDCVRFDPYVPVGHEKANFIFGYDAEVKFTNGRRFFSPTTLTGSHLLTNEAWRLKYSEKDKDDFWLRKDLPIRATAKGIAGVALPGRECSFYVHPDDFVITQHLKDVELEVKPNQHTRYAQGLVRRIGGLEKVLNLINDGGFDILSALASRSTAARGFRRDVIKRFLIKNRSFSQKEADNLLNQKLQPLLASGLVRRGYSLECPHCNLCNWYLLEEMSEFVECRGCAENFQVPLKGVDFTYEPNELAAQLIQEGGLVVLMTAALLKRIPNLSSGFLQFGGDLFPIGAKVNTNEVDLFWLTEDALIIAECKSFFDLNVQRDEEKLEKRVEEIKESLVKNVELAKRIDAKAVLLGIATNLPEIPNLFDIVADLAKSARDQKIGFHLALNGKVHLWGNEAGLEPREIKLGNLLVEEENLLGEWSVGESPGQYGGAVGSNGLFNEETLKRWELELRA